MSWQQFRDQQNRGGIRIGAGAMEWYSTEVLTEDIITRHGIGALIELEI